MQFYLESSRLIIRPFQDSDLDSFMSYRNDPAVAKFQGWSLPYTLDQGKQFIAEMNNADPKQTGEWFQVALEEKQSRVMIGDVAYFIMKNDPRQAYIGCTVAPSRWRHGYACESTNRLLDYLFTELDLHRVVAETDVQNTPSIKVLEKVGFRREAHLVENIWFKGAYASEYHYALLKREWESR